jgi:hypothetical protein
VLPPFKGGSGWVRREPRINGNCRSGGIPAAEHPDESCIITSNHEYPYYGTKTQPPTGVGCSLDCIAPTRGFAPFASLMALIPSL